MPDFYVNSTGAHSTVGYDNSAAIQLAIDVAVAQGNTVVVPEGTFYVNALRPLQLRPGSRIRIEGVLAALPNDQPRSAVLYAGAISDVRIELFGQIIGERAQHIGTVGEHGMGVACVGSQDVMIAGSGSISGCWGDGIYIESCKGVVVADITSAGNRRNAMSVIAVDTLDVVRSTFSNTSGTDPQCGIDLEPDNNLQEIKNVGINGCHFVGNAGAGIYFGLGAAPLKNFSNIQIKGNEYKGNKPIGGVDSIPAKLLYATCSWLPWYDYWGIDREVSIP